MPLPNKTQFQRQQTPAFQDHLAKQRGKAPAVSYEPVHPVPPKQHATPHAQGGRDTEKESAYRLDAKAQQSMRLYRTGMYEVADAAERGVRSKPLVRHLQSVCLNGTSLWEKMAGAYVGRSDRGRRDTR